MSKNQREVKFTKEFANKKKDDVEKYDSMLSSRLVHVDKVAVYTEEEHKNRQKTVKEALALTEKKAKK